MNTTKAYTNVIKVIMAIVFFFSAMSMACDEGPTNPSEAIINLAVPTQQNILSGGN